MQKVFLVIANYQNEKQEIFDKFISPSNRRYCNKHGFKYMPILTPPPLFRGNPTWWKFTIVADMLKNGQLQDGDVLTNFDADMVIMKDDLPYQTTKSFSYAIDNGNTHCMGNYTLNVNPWSRQLIANILDEELWNRNKYKPHWLDFREQAAWYSLCGIIPHSWNPFLSMPDNGFHSSYDQSEIKYSIEELEQHVEVRGPQWNTTLLEEEFDITPAHLQIYNITRSKKADTIVRHFAGGQPWQASYYQYAV